MSLERDTIIHKRYRIVESLGQGGMGSVYRAVDENLGMDVALKENLFTTDEYARQFRLEAVILANLRHPNLPRVSDHFVMGEQGQYLVMDFIDGEDLRQRMERLGVLSEDDVINIGAALCDALSYLHSRKPPILHRDIKPGNVKITPDGHIYLVDFGLAKVFQGSQATTTGARAMTPGYSPPEQYGTGRTDPRTDIYSLGATLYAALTGIIPEDGLARAMDNAQLTPVRKRSPKVSRRLATVIERAMSIDPADRFQTADDFKKGLLDSKSRTQQLTGTYTVSPPPGLDVSKLAEAVDSIDATNSNAEKRQMVGGPISPPKPGFDLDQPFVPPMKRKQQRDRRRWRIILTTLLAVLIVGFFGVAFLSPGTIPQSVHDMLPFLPAAPTATPTITPTPTLTPSPTITETPTFTPSATLPPAANLSETPLLTPASPTPFGADKLQLAFASARSGMSQIYITDLLGGEAVQITNMPEGACQPSWSPDGQRLVFISPCIDKVDQYPKSSMYIINADGSGLTPLPTVPGGDFEPAWSPDGTRIAFTSLRDGRMQIYIYRFEDNSMLRIIRTDPTTSARQPAWSPDSKRIAYAFNRTGDGYQIWTMNDDGSDQKQLFRSGSQVSDSFPFWSADGNLIFFNQRSLKESSLSNLLAYTIGSEGDPIKIPVGSNSAEDIDIAPGGLWIAFESSTGNIQDVYYMSISGANVTRLTSSRKSDFDPVWRPIPVP